MFKNGSDDCNFDPLAPRSLLLMALQKPDEKGADLWSAEESQNNYSTAAGILQFNFDASSYGVLDYGKFLNDTGLNLFEYPPGFTEIFVEGGLMAQM